MSTRDRRLARLGTRLSEFLFPRLLRPLLLAILAVTLLACHSRPAAPPRPGRAVIVYAPNRTDDAEVAGRALQRLGYVVELQLEGPVSRSKSSVAMYGLKDAPDRADRVKSALDSLGDLEYLPFPGRGAGDTDVVVWLIAAEGGMPEAPVPEAPTPEAPTPEAE